MPSTSESLLPEIPELTPDARMALAAALLDEARTHLMSAVRLLDAKGLRPDQARAAHAVSKVDQARTGLVR